MGNLPAGLWIGRIFNLIVVLFMLFDCSIKLAKLPAAVVGTVELGYPANLVPVIGAILLVCVILYAVPQTAVLGAIFLTGYLGGAVASTMRVGKPVGFDLFPVCVALLLWMGLYLREPMMRALVPLRTRELNKLSHTKTGS